MKKEIKDTEETAPSGITRKDAIKKMGKYAALTALGTFMILNPKKAQATSASPSPSPSPDSGGSGSGSGGGSDTPPSPPGWDD
jgi:PAB1-binding protein PBP1